ncbi:hypothetical protein [Oceanicola sp. 22II-s10i]|uniref:hypothetical protein n=1 Tax=Oceanicola sp. 22II-s10i TaxID=1317116 RepID=UPI0015953D77|nr:hypothetical protein [Oceanicola sp. 22II-s10i]
MQNLQDKSQDAARAALAALDDAWAYYDPMTEGKVVPLHEARQADDTLSEYYEAA